MKTVEVPIARLVALLKARRYVDDAILCASPSEFLFYGDKVIITDRDVGVQLQVDQWRAEWDNIQWDLEHKVSPGQSRPPETKCETISTGTTPAGGIGQWLKTLISALGSTLKSATS